MKKSPNIDHWLPHIHTCTYSTHTFSQTEKYMPSVASKEKAKMANKCMRGKPGSLSERNQQNNKLYQINKVSIGQVEITLLPLKQTAVVVREHTHASICFCLSGAMGVLNANTETQEV